MMWPEKYIGLPYKTLGRDLNGIDCYGLVYLIFKHELGIDLPIINTGYDNGLNCQNVAPVFEQGLKDFISDSLFKKTDKIKEFNVILFRRSGYISHIATCVDKRTFIHADLGAASCIENINRNYWKNRIVGVYEYTGTS